VSVFLWHGPAHYSCSVTTGDEDVARHCEKDAAEDHHPTEKEGKEGGKERERG
jgi:hypothetical protein